jgi:Bax protein
MQETSLTYKNLAIFLVALLLINIAVGFYNSFAKKKNFDGLSVNYTIRNANLFETNPSDVTVDYISESSEMIEIFKKYQFSVDSLLNNQSANLIIFSSLPKDFMEIQPVVERKRLFINTLIPIIYSENVQILNDRKKILDWWRESDGENFSRDFWPQWLFELSEKYGSSDSNLGNLLVRVDIIPISLALAQAAIESGWGTSRYSREGNAVYGQYTFDESKGLKPKNRNENDQFFIKRFSNLSESVRSYLKNINTHLAYADFREERKKLRMSGENLSGYKLVNFLKDYSERKESYVKDVKEIMTSNNFQKFDKGYSLN